MVWAQLAAAGAKYGKAYLKGRAAKKAQEQQIAEQQAYSKWLAEKATEKESQLGEMAKTGEEQFLTETGEALPELQQSMEDIRAGATEEQQRAGQQLETALARQGVRGGQAATLQSRGIGQTNVDLSRMINEMALKEASRRRDIRAPYFAQKAQTPWAELAGTRGYGSKAAFGKHLGVGKAAFQAPTTSGGQAMYGEALS